MDRLLSERPFCSCEAECSESSRLFAKAVCLMLNVLLSGPVFVFVGLSVDARVHRGRSRKGIVEELDRQRSEGLLVFRDILKDA